MSGFARQARAFRRDMGRHERVARAGDAGDGDSGRCRHVMRSVEMRAAGVGPSVTHRALRAWDARCAAAVGASG